MKVSIPIVKSFHASNTGDGLMNAKEANLKIEEVIGSSEEEKQSRESYKRLNIFFCLQKRTFCRENPSDSLDNKPYFICCYEQNDYYIVYTSEVLMKGMAQQT